MKYIIALKDILITILAILALFSFLSFISKEKIPVIQQNNEVIMLSPMEAYLRGSIKLDGDNSIINWRNEKNIVHWRFNCSIEGTYKATLLHNKTSKYFDLTLSCREQKLNSSLSLNSKETELGKLTLSRGQQELALFVPDFPKKSKLPAIFSIIITKIN